MNEADSSISSAYFLNDVPCPLLPHNNAKLANFLGAYDLIRKDLEHSASAIETLIEIINTGGDSENPKVYAGNDSRDFTIMKSLYQSAFVSYSKCFSNSSGGGRGSKTEKRGVKLEKKIVDDLIPGFREIHHQVMLQRNEYVSHGGSTDLEGSFSSESRREVLMSSKMLLPFALIVTVTLGTIVPCIRGEQGFHQRS